MKWNVFFFYKKSSEISCVFQNHIGCPLVSMDNRFSTVKCTFPRQSTDILVKAFPSSVFAQSFFWHHTSLQCPILNASADALCCHFVSEAHLPSILRQKCLVCRESSSKLRDDRLAARTFMLSLDTKLEYELNGVYFKDCANVVHGCLTCPLLRTSTPEPIPLDIVSVVVDHIACAICVFFGS